MAESYSVKAILSAVDRNFSSTFKSISNSANKIGDNFSRSTKPVSGFMSSVGKIAGAIGLTKVVGMLGSGLGSMVGELNDSSKAWQTFEGNMKFLGKKPAEIKSVERSLQKYAQQTIYSSSDMASAYAQFAAVGVKGVGKLVKGMGGLAAATDNPKQAMATLMQQSVQAAAKPTIQWQDFRLMLEQTPAGMAAVAKAMGMTTKQLVSNVQAGKIKTQQFFDAVAKAGNNKTFQKMATQYKTVGDAMDGLKETLANKLQPAWQAMSKVAINAINPVIDAVGNIDFMKIIKSIGNFVAPFTQAMGQIKSKMTSTFSNLDMSGLKTSFANVGKFIQTIMKTVAMMIANSFGVVAKVAQKIGSAFQKVFSGSGNAKIFNDLSSVVSNFGKVASDVFTAIGNVMANLPWVAIFTAIKTTLQAVASVLRTVASLIKKAFANDVIRSFAIGILGAFTAFKAFGGAIAIIARVVSVFSAVKAPIVAIVSVMRSLNMIVQVAGGIWKAFGLIVGANPFVLIATAIAAVVAALVYFFTQTKTGQKIWQDFVSFLQSAWQSIASTAQSIWGNVSSFASSAATTVSNTWNTAMTWLSGVWQSIVGVAQSVWGNVTNTASTAATGVSTVWTNVMAVLSTIWQNIANVAMTIFGALKESLIEIWSAVSQGAVVAWQSISASLATAWNGIIQMASGIWGLLKAVVMGPVLIVIDLLTGSWSKLGADLNLIWQSIVSSAAQIWNGLKAFLSGIWSATVTVAKVMWNGFAAFMQACWLAIKINCTTVWNAIKQMITNATKAVVATAQGIWNGFKSFMSSLWSSIKSIAASTWNGIKSAISNAIISTVSTAKGLWNGLRSFMSGLWAGIKGTAISAWNSLRSSVIGIARSVVSGVRSAWSGFTRIVAGVVSGIKSGFNALRGFSLAGAGRAIMDSFFGGLKSAWSGVQNFVSGIASWIRKHKGPISYDRKLLIPAGQAIMNGLNAGLVANFAKVQKNVSGMSDKIASAFTPTLDTSISDTINGVRSQSGTLGIASTIAMKDSTLQMQNNALLRRIADKPTDLYLDTDTLVGSTADAYDHKLGEQAIFSGRWNR